MSFCHFSKVRKGTSWSDLKANQKIQMDRKCRKLEYLELITIVVNQEEFEQICNDISSSNHYYQKYTHQATATLDGKWKCIVIKNQSTTQEIILYTAGRLYPLYAAIRE